MGNDTPQPFKNSFHSFLSVEFNLSSGQIHPFFSILQKGFMVKTRVGVSVQTFLSNHLALSPEYIRDRVKTIFLDGKAVDELDKALVQDGSRLALSAALPGLAGAVLRRGSPFAGLRSQVDGRKQGTSKEPKEGFVYLKLFNLLLPEMGPTLLERGVMIPRKDFLEFWEGLPEQLWREWGKARVNGKETEVGQIQEWLLLNSFDWILLTIHGEVLKE
jgi:hypothetical protein